MLVGTRTETQRVNSEIIEDFYENVQSVAAIAKKYGRSTSIINRVLATYRQQYMAEHGCEPERKARPKDPRTISGKKPLSKIHADIGVVVGRYATEHRLSPTELGAQLSCSRVVARNITLGAHDLTLIEVMRIAELLGQSVVQVMYPLREQRLHAVG